MDEAGKKGSGRSALPRKGGRFVSPSAVASPVQPAATALGAVHAVQAQASTVAAPAPAAMKAPAPVPAAIASPEPAAREVAAEAVPAAAPAPSDPIEPIEAATSPAVSSDPIAAEMIAPLQEKVTAMATVAPNMTDTAAATTEKMQTLLGDVGARFKASFEKSSKLGEEMVELTKGNVEAVVASARVAAKGGEVLGQDAAEYSKKSFESAVAAMKGFASVKTPTELFQLQSDFAKASFDSAVAEASRFSESMMKLAGDVAQPLSTRYSVAAEKIKAVAL